MNGVFYKIDKFAVPPPARDEFLMHMVCTHTLLQTQQGFTRHSVLEQVAGPGEFNFVTIAEWENAEAFEQSQATANLSPQEMFERLGIRADIAGYKPVAA
ncbi:antibiotic biosynthesis monooxygenase [Rhizobium leguminosarum]|uniref:antibiotic biosynthesis monooxygenase n=1 Tax=Rhizobium leguminosarum TaxID=384 RepID=UPI001C93DDB6|nr:antibiotic biosynthesis monooxygenase [Rhizobium leguminosarum]MBY5346272.1 antibiotic biosynthesis monooxygenase [Rhizobium leguminosarum]MBY5361373.1 antibiotic biosynthesis monooxygenase [Rhizobium leguminosarum]